MLAVGETSALMCVSMMSNGAKRTKWWKRLNVEKNALGRKVVGGKSDTFANGSKFMGGRVETIHCTSKMRNSVKNFCISERQLFCQPKALKNPGVLLEMNWSFKLTNVLYKFSSTVLTALLQ